MEAVPCTGTRSAGFYLGDISKVEEVVDLGRCGQETLDHSVIHL